MHKAPTMIGSAFISSALAFLKSVARYHNCAVRFCEANISTPDRFAEGNDGWWLIGNVAFSDLSGIRALESPPLFNSIAEATAKVVASFTFETSSV